MYQQRGKYNQAFGKDKDRHKIMSGRNNYISSFRPLPDTFKSFIAATDNVDKILSVIYYRNNNHFYI